MSHTQHPRAASAAIVTPFSAAAVATSMACHMLSILWHHRVRVPLSAPARQRLTSAAAWPHLFVIPCCDLPAASSGRPTAGAAPAAECLTRAKAALLQVAACQPAQGPYHDRHTHHRSSPGFTLLLTLSVSADNPCWSCRAFGDGHLLECVAADVDSVGCCVGQPSSAKLLYDKPIV